MRTPVAYASRQATAEASCSKSGSAAREDNSSELPKTRKADHLPPDQGFRGTKRARPTTDILSRIRADLEKGEFKIDPNQPIPPHLRPGASAVQSGCYALEVLSCTYGTRASCFGLTVLDDEIFLWHYDACGIMYTDESLSFVDDFEDAVAVIVGILNCNAQ